jgi:hypothetical protein
VVESVPDGVEAYSGFNFAPNYRIATAILGQVCKSSAHSVGKWLIYL